MKRAFFIIILLAAAGLGASFFLIPRASEVALMRYKDKQFEAAREVYEQQFKDGTVTPEVVNTLVDLYLQAGDVNGAISVMEQFIATRPADLESRKRLGELYQFAERPDDYLKNLEEINRLQPSAETLKALSQIYNYRTDYAKQAEALKALINMPGQNAPQVYIDLANILATQKDATAAIIALNDLKKNRPESFTFREQELLVSLLLDEKRYDEALASAKEWRAKNPPAAESARLINMLHLRGNAKMGEELLATYDNAIIEGENSLLAERVLLMMNGGNEAEAYAKLRELNDKGVLSADMQNRLLFLSIERGDEETAQALLEKLDIASLNEQQALALLEISVARGDASMQKRLTENFGREDYRAQYPLLSTMISVISRTADSRDKLAELAKQDLTPQQNLQVARICIRMKDYGCSETFLSRLPESDQLNDAEVASVAELYYELKAYDKGYAFVKRMTQTRNSQALDNVRVKFAAVKGDDAAVSEWMTANADTASTRQLTDLFFATRNHKHPALALRIAETIYAREQTPATRSMLASSYVSGGQYAKAVALLRGARELSAADESNYLTALTRLARNNDSYRAELGRYAASRLNGNLPQKQKLALIYALVQAGRMDIAMPHVRTLAMKEGGQWAWLYANELDKQGKHAEAREFWITIASQPITSTKQKREIAFNLLNSGYPNDAEPIFRELAANAPADSDDVRTLLYIWGPRLSGEQLDWLAARYNAAPDGEHIRWADYIATYASSDDIVDFAESRHPETLFAGPVWHRYLETLAKSGQLRDKHAPLLKAAQEYGSASIIGIYAEVARVNDYKREARQAYEALFALDPNDNNALYQLGMVSFAQADYTASKMYFEEYLNGPAAKDTPDHAVSAHFYYGDLLRKNRRMEDPMPAASPYYAQVVKIVDEANLTAPDMLAKKAQSLIYLGQEEEGLNLFAQASNADPSNDVIRADWATALLQQRRYDEAKGLISEPMSRLQQPIAAEALVIPANALVEQKMLAGNTEALLALHGSDEDIRQFASNAEAMPWVGYASMGHGRVLIGAKPGYIMQVAQDANGQVTLTPVPAATDETRRQTRLRYELIAARIDIETGKILAATQRLNGLLPEYPADAQLIGFAANAENYGGNWARAQALLKVAHNIAPENEDVALLNRDINRQYGNGVKLDHEWVSRGNDSENITTLSGLADANEKLKVGISVQNNNVEGKGVRRANGNVGSFRANKQRMELWAMYHWEEGRRLKAALFANNDTPGAGVYYEWLNRLGESGVGAEIHRPYWEYIEGVLDDATRDRLSVWHTIKPHSRVSIRLEPGVNRYNVEDKEDVASTWSMDARVVYRPIERLPYLYLAYGLSAEYMIDKEFKLDNFGAAYKRLPVESREVHFVAVNAGHEFSDATYGEVLAGYGYDRLGGNGPMIEGKITHEFNENFDAQLRAGYGIDVQESKSDITRVGGYVRWRF